MDPLIASDTCYVENERLKSVKAFFPSADKFALATKVFNKKAFDYLSAIHELLP